MISGRRMESGNRYYRGERADFQCYFRASGQELPHNPYDQEVRELDSIRHGDVEMLNRSLAGNLSLEK